MFDTVQGRWLRRFRGCVRRLKALCRGCVRHHVRGALWLPWSDPCWFRWVRGPCVVKLRPTPNDRAHHGNPDHHFCAEPGCLGHRLCWLGRTRRWSRSRAEKGLFNACLTQRVLLRGVEERGKFRIRKFVLFAHDVLSLSSAARSEARPA